MKSWKAIWTEIAEAYDTNRSKRSEEQEQIAGLGLCHALRAMADNYCIPNIIMPFKYGYWWGHGDKGRAGRIMFAGLMAAMGDKGFEEFLTWCKDHQ